MSMRSLTKSTGIVMASRLLISFSNILFIPLMAKNLSVSDYGIWAQVWITLPLISGILILGFGEAMSRYFPTMTKNDYSTAFSSMILPISIFSSLLAILIYIFSGDIAEGIFDGNISIVRYLAIFSIIGTINLAFYSLLRALKYMKEYGALTIFQNVAELGLAVTMVLIGKGVEGAVFAILLTRGILLLFFILFTQKLITIRKPDLSKISGYLKFSLPILPMVLSIWTLSVADRYMIAIFHSTKEVGFYDPAYTIGQSIPMMIVWVLSFTLTPYLSKMYDSDEIEEVKDTLKFMLKLSITINLPFILGSMVLSRDLLSFISTNLIAANAYKILPMIAIAVSLNSFKALLSQTWILEKKTYKIGATYSFSAILNVFLNLILIPYYGIMGAAFATLLSYAFDLFISILWTTREYIPILKKNNIMKIIISSILMYVIVYITYNYSPILQTTVAILSGLLVYLATINVLKILNAHEREVVEDIPLLNRLIK